MAADEFDNFGFRAPPLVAQVSVEIAGEQQHARKWERPRERLTGRASEHEERRITDLVCRQARRPPRLPSRCGPLRAMMLRGDVSEAARAEAMRHRARFVERVPSEARIQSSDRRKAIDR